MPTSPIRAAHSRALYLAVLLLVSLHFSLAYVTETFPYFSYVDFAQGNVEGPYNTRILVALLFRPAVHWQALARLSAHLPGDLSQPLVVLMVPLAALSIFFATDAVRSASQAVGVEPAFARWAAFLLPLMAYFHYVLAPELRVQVPYDLPQVLFFALCLAGALRGNRLLFYTSFLLGTLNRETTCFLIPLFGILHWSCARARGLLPRRSLLLGELALQSVLWLGVRFFASHFFTDHPVMTDQLTAHGFKHLGLNIHFCLNPLHWPTLLSLFGFLWIALLLGFRKIEHRGLMTCAWLLLPWTVLMFLVGDILEIRIFSEWLSYVAVCLTLIATHTLRSANGVRLQPADAGEQTPA